MGEGTEQIEATSEAENHEEGQKTGCILVDSDIAVWGYGREEALHFGVNHAYQPQVL